MRNKRARKGARSESPSEEAEEQHGDVNNIDESKADVQADEVDEEVEEEPERRYHLTHVIRENATRPIVRVQMKRVGDESIPQGEASARSLVLTVGGDQANVYEGKYLDLASHFVHAPNEHVPTVGGITCSSWIESDPDVNDALFALGTSDGIISVISLAESRVIKRLGEDKGSQFTVVDMAGHPNQRNVVASLLMDVKTNESTVEIWDVETGVVMKRVQLAGTTPYETIHYVPNCDKETIAVSKGDEVFFFEQGVQSDSKKLPGKTTSLRFLGNRDDVLVLTATGGAIQYNLTTKERKLPFPKTVKFSAVNSTADGRFITAGDDRGGAYVVDRDTGDAFALRSHKTKAMTVTSLAFVSLGAKEVVCASNDGAIWRWVFRDTTTTAATASSNNGGDVN